MKDSKMQGMRKKYVVPQVCSVVLENLCENGLVLASVQKGQLGGQHVDQFDVVEENQTKTDGVYSNLWGNANKDKWGDD